MKTRTASGKKKHRWIWSLTIQESLVLGGVKIEIELKEETVLNLASEKEHKNTTRTEKKRKSVEERQCFGWSLLLDFELFSFVPLRLN